MTKTQPGFSLIELSVVLVLVSLATAMVLPNLSSAYNNLQSRSELDEMMLRASALGYEAYSDGRGITIATQQDAIRLLQPTQDWQIEIILPVVVTATGVCLGGELAFVREEFSKTVRLTPPYCHIEDQDSPDAG